MGIPSVLGLSERQFCIAVAIAVALAGLICYSNTFMADFVWDDASSILLHKHVQDPTKFVQLFREDQHAFGRGQGNFYRPLVAASFMLDMVITRAFSPDGTVPGLPVVSSKFNLSPFIFHVTSVLWHIAAAVALSFLLGRLAAPRFVQAAVPLIYVVHPLHTEAVAYVSGRADSMSAAFMFAGLCFATWDDSGRKRVLGALLSSACFIGGLLSKESATIYPLLLAIVIFARPVTQGERKEEYLRRLLPLVLAAVLLGAYAWLRMTVLKFAQGSTTASPLGQRLVETMQAFALYIRLLFMPLDLHMERTLTGASSLTTVAGAALLVLMLMLFVLSIYRKRYRVAAGLIWFLVTWLPISGIFPLNAPMAEHWLYVPMAGLLLAFMEVLNDASARPWVVRVATVGVTAACVWFAALTVARNSDWRDNETLFLATLADNPGSARVQYNLAVTYEDLLRNAPGARRHYEAVVNLYKEKKAREGTPQAFWDDELESYLSLGRIYMKDQQYQKAAEHYMQVLGIAADQRHRSLVASAAVGLVQCAMATGEMTQASEVLKKVLAADPQLKAEVERMLLGTGQTPLTSSGL